ncbi:MAG: hypothetical protein IT376_12695 [Polyangiaceae bacterium]|nr:hypothetical protein [Polyangiaceae bacterium]
MRSPASRFEVRWLPLVVSSLLPLLGCDEESRSKEPIPGNDAAAEGSVGGTGGGSGAGGASGAGGSAGASGSAGAAGAGGSAGAAGASGSAGAANTVTFVEEFVGTGDLDLAASTSTVDVSGPGRVHAPPPFTLGDPGDGSDGALNVGLSGDVELPAGEYQYTSVTVEDANLYSMGDLTLHVQGDLVVNGALEASGALTIYVGGQVRLINGVVQSWTSSLTLHQRSRLPLVVSGGYSTAGFAPYSGSVEVFAMGPIDLAGGFWSDDAGTGPSGGVVVRAADTITMGDSTLIGILRSGGSPSAGGGVAAYTERDLLIPNGYLSGENATVAGGEVVARAEGDITLGADGAMFAGVDGAVDVVAGGTFSLDDFVFTDGGGSVTVRAAAIALGSGASVFHYGAADTGSPGVPQLVDLATPGDFSLAGELAGGPTFCGPGGSVEVRAGGALSLAAQSRVVGGGSVAGSACSAGVGGAVTLLAAGAYTADATAVVQGGAGATPGAVTALGGQPLTVPPSPPGVVTWTTVTSAALPVQAAGAVLQSASATWLVERREPGVLEIALDGATWQPAATAVGGTLANGWRYRVRLPTGQFESAELDRVTVVYTVP